MVEINGEPRIKLSQDVMKVTMPGKKTAYRLYGSDGKSSKILLDIILKLWVNEVSYCVFDWFLD